MSFLFDILLLLSVLKPKKNWYANRNKIYLFIYYFKWNCAFHTLQESEYTEPKQWKRENIHNLWRCLMVFVHLMLVANGFLFNFIFFWWCFSSGFALFVRFLAQILFMTTQQHPVDCWMQYFVCILKIITCTWAIQYQKLNRNSFVSCIIQWTFSESRKINGRGRRIRIIIYL